MCSGALILGWLPLAFPLMLVLFGIGLRLQFVAIPCSVTNLNCEPPMHAQKRLDSKCFLAIHDFSGLGNKVLQDGSLFEPSRHGPIPGSWRRHPRNARWPHRLLTQLEKPHWRYILDLVPVAQ